MYGGQFLWQSERSLKVSPDLFFGVLPLILLQGSFQPLSIGDGLLEVVGITSPVHMVGFSQGILPSADDYLG